MEHKEKRTATYEAISDGPANLTAARASENDVQILLHVMLRGLNRFDSTFPPF